jgi:hypothetical protein
VLGVFGLVFHRHFIVLVLMLVSAVYRTAT